jgi:Rho-binding antiterminator
MKIDMEKNTETSTETLNAKPTFVPPTRTGTQTGNRSDYKPVHCDLTDELEALAIQKKPINLKYRTEAGSTDWKLGHIQDLFTKDHADFLKLVDGTVIRLDRIVEWRL